MYFWHFESFCLFLLNFITVLLYNVFTWSLDGTIEPCSKFLSKWQNSEPNNLICRNTEAELPPVPFVAVLFKLCFVLSCFLKKKIFLTLILRGGCWFRQPPLNTNRSETITKHTGVSTCPHPNAHQPLYYLSPTDVVLVPVQVLL